jgi:hypothetical protein
MVCGSTLSWGIGYSNWDFLGFSQSLQKNATKLGYDRFVPHTFQFIINRHPTIQR